MDESTERPAKAGSENPDLDGASTAKLDRDGLTGSLLDGRYLIKRTLGRGGFGVVYLASDEKMMSRPVVVKALRDKEIDNKWSVRKFKQEMEALARIDHPSIVGIFDTGQLPDGNPYIVIQYVDGSSLRSLITSQGMDFWRAANIIRQIGRALGAAHERGILHRDLKPENIMVQSLGAGDEQVKIIDFGIAKVKNSLVSLSTADDRAVGTVAYMSPEQLTAGTLSPASDVYSFAVIAYEMLTGRRPTNPDSAFQLLELQRSGVGVRPIDLRPSIPPAAEAAILKGLSFEAGDRFERARDFGDVLASAVIDDDEQTRLQVPVERKEVRERQQADTLSLETAHVLFMDIVGYSKSLMDTQRTRLNQLQQIVLDTNECRQTRPENLIRLPTGDGMALVFFGDPEGPVRCAVEISRTLKVQPDLIELRMGVHSGLVYRIADINTNMNVAGGGINVAQRVMDCGDGGHLLVSKRVAEDLNQLARWSDHLHDLGEAEVKHGLRVHLFNLYGDDFGNPDPPAKFPVASKLPIYKRAPVIVAASLAILVLAVAGTWYGLSPKTTSVDPATRPETLAPVGTEQSVTFWLTVQKMVKDKPIGEPFNSAGQEIFGNGWKFRFNLRPTQSGALYLLNVGPGKNGAQEYNVLFPLPTKTGPDPKVPANATMQSGWSFFTKHTGAEKLWIIWSTQPVHELDAIFGEVARNEKDPGVIATSDQIAQIQFYLKKFDTSRPEIIPDKSNKLTTVKGRGDILVTLVELSHEPY